MKMNPRKKNQYQSNISWPDVVFLAEAEREPFANVQILTLYAHCLNEAEETGRPLSRITFCEFVEVFEDRVLIVVDVETIDDESVAKALDLLTHMDNFQVGNKKEFGSKKMFNYKRVH